MQITLYGIPNCNQIKKARTWLIQHQINHHFHDYKKSGINAEILTQWFTLHPWEDFINRKGTTWRKFDESVQKTASDLQATINLLCTYTSLIKRPVLQYQLGDHANLLVGFDCSSYEAFFKHRNT